MTTKLALKVSDQTLSELKAQFPAEQGFTRTLLPRLGMASQDKTEGKGKAMKVITEAGTFFIEKQTDEENEEGKKIWAKEEIGAEVEVTVLYQRKQLRYFDESLEQYTSSPVYDTDEEVVPLFCNKQEVCRGTPADLKARPEYQYEKDGKKKSKLEENRILYVLYKDETYQLNLRGSSMWSWVKWSRQNLPPAIITKMASDAKEKGSIAWNQMTFEKVRDLDENEIKEVMARIDAIKEGIKQEKMFYTPVEVVKEKEF